MTTFTLPTKRRILITGALCVLASPLAGLTQLGNGDVYLEGQLDILYDSNVFINNAATRDDTLAVFYAGASFVQEQRSVLNVEIGLGVEVARFLDFGEEDYEDLKSSFAVSYPNNIERNGYFELSGGYNETTYASEDVGQRIQGSVLDLEGLYQFDLSDKVGWELSVSTETSDYSRGEESMVSNRTFATNSDILMFKVVPTYQYSEKLFLTGLLQARDLNYNSAASVDQSGTVLAAGARGQLLPKVSGGIFIGFQSIDLTSPLEENNSNYTDPFYSVDVSWAPREGTRVTLSGSSNFQSTVLGDVNNRRDINLRVSEQLSFRTNLSAGIGYSNNSYEGFFDRTDKALRLDVGYSRNLNQRMALNARVSYQDRDSSISFEGVDNITVFSFDKLLVSVGVNTVW